MPQKKGAKGKVTRKKRVDVLVAVEAMIAGQCRQAEIARTLAPKFGISERQVHRYIRYAYNELAKDAEKDRHRLKHQLRESLRAVVKKALQSNQLGAAVAALDRLGKLDGLWEPTKIEATVRNVELMTSDQQRKRLFALAAKAGVPLSKPNGPDKANGAGNDRANGSGNGHAPN